MKRILVLLLLIPAFHYGQAQLNGTKWKATLQLDNPVDVMLDFRKDTVEATVVADNSSLETMVYTVKDSVLTLQKLWGQSQCDEGVIGSYIMQKSDSSMLLTLKEDACDDRSQVLDKSRWEPVK